MMELKSCPKCHGDMFLDRDNYGAFRQCLQCGLIKDLVDPSAIVTQPMQPKAKKQAGAKATAKKVAA